MIQEVRTRLSSGETVTIRASAGDPHWREKALAGLDPLSDLAFAIRRAPQTAAEIAAWDEYVRRQDMIRDLHALTQALHGLQTALFELGGVE
jgi:hypothetical protein